MGTLVRSGHIQSVRRTWLDVLEQYAVAQPRRLGALQLPLSPLATVTLSYLSRLSAYALTLYWLGRAAGVSRLAAVYALGLFILFNLPPFN